MAKTTDKKTVKVDRRVTWAQAFRDIIVGAMNKGQLLPVTLALVLLLIVARMDPKDLPSLGIKVLELLHAHEMIGYGLWAATVVGWVVHARFVKGTTDAESGRIGKEKTGLQEQLAGRKFTSSRKK